MTSEGGFAEQPQPATHPSLTQQQYDPATTRLVLRRAFELDHREPTRDIAFTRSTLAEIAAEVDLPVQAVAAALAEQMADGTDGRSLLDRFIGSDRVSVHRQASVPEHDMRDRAVRLLEVGHGMRPRIQSDGVVVATKRKDFVGKIASTLRDAQGLGQLGKMRRVEVASVDVGDEPGALVISADIGDRRNNAVAGGAAVTMIGGVLVVSAAVALSPFIAVATPLAVAAGVATSRAVHGAAERDVREHLEEAADALVRGDEPDGLISRSTRKVLESIRRSRRGRRR